MEYILDTRKESSLYWPHLIKEGAALKFNASAFDNFKMLLDKDFEPVDSGCNG